MPPRAIWSVRSIDRHRRCHLDRSHQRRHPGVAQPLEVSWIDVTIPGTEIGARLMLTTVETSTSTRRPRYATLDTHFRATTRRTSTARAGDYGKHVDEDRDRFAADAAQRKRRAVVRADPQRRGLLFAGHRECHCTFSFDDGDHCNR